MFDVIGIIAFALSGYLSATREKADILGIFIAAFATALAGGMFRDIAVNKTPFVFSEIYPLILITGTVLFAILFKLHTKNVENKDFYIVADTFGLISFSIAGSLVAQEYNLNLTGFILLALITATGGGVVKDLLLQKKPVLLNTDIYGTLAIMIGIIIYILGDSPYVIWTTFVAFFLFKAFYKKE
jgi:uncharacterized membrane protein YeiH